MTKSQQTESTVKTQSTTQDQQPRARLVKGTKKDQIPGPCRPGAYA